MTTTTRFHPQRAGILNLWHFRDVELPFDDGRLVLRGANGAGKTKALELLFPLVLDGSLDPRRLDPFSSDGRRMRDNVLAAADAGGHRAAIGYAWLTFARTSEAGAEERVTVGVGVSGSHERDRVDSWTFVTDRTPGADFALLDDEDRPLSRTALKQALGADHVFDTVEAHRRAVDARLFGLGEDRFHRMIELVLQLRKPKLAALLDPERISHLLSLSLRPIDGEALDDVARGLAELERIADEIAGMERAVRSLEALHRDHATYLRAHARARLDARTKAGEDVRARDEELAQNAQAHAGAQQRAVDAEQAEVAWRVEATSAEGEIQGLEQSDAYRAGGTLHDRERVVEGLARSANGAVAAEQAAEQRALRAHEALAAVEEEHDQLAREIRSGAERLARAAPEAVGALACDLDSDANMVRVAVGAAVAMRRAGLRAVGEAVATWETARVRADEAGRLAEQALDRENEARREHRASMTLVEDARTALAAAARGWAAAHAPVSAEDLDAVLVRVVDGDRGEVAGLPELVRTRWEPRKLGLVADEQRAMTSVTDARAHLGDLRAQRERIAAAQEESPPDSPWRTASREGRAGAPLWRLVDFAPHLDPAERAGLEGALLAAGLLDAWVDPPGVSRPFVVDDAFLVPSDAQAGATLADVLVPEAAGDAMRAHVLGVLRCVAVGGLDQVTVGVDPSGRFRVGPLVGGLRCERARYVGATAREAERARRLFEMDALIADAEAEQAARAEALRAVQADRAALDLAMRALPDHRPVVAALEREDRCVHALELASEARQRADAGRAARVRERDDADATRRRTAAEQGLPPDRKGLDAASGALTGFTRDADMHVGKLEQRPRLAQRRADAARACEQAEGEHTVAKDEREVVKERLARESAELGAIKASIGAAYDEVLEHINAARARAADARGREREQRAAAARAREAASGLAGARPQIEARRDDAAGAFTRAGAAVDAMLVPAFALVLDLGDARTVERLDAACADVSASEQQMKRVETVLQSRFEVLQKDAGSRLRVIATSQHGLQLFEVDDEGREPSAAYARRLAARLDEHRVLLADRERAVFEDHLLGTLCTALYQRLRAARGFAREADRELRRRPLASGVHFGMAWKPRQDVAPHEEILLDVLRRDADHLGPRDLDRVRQALRGALRHLRAEKPTVDQRALLDDALDYRRWHRFSIVLCRGEGHPEHELTRHKHAQLSGGEKAAALYAPLFAAARATFAGGDPVAPRLVALDEAFEGIDAVGRPELLAMTVAFDLDLLLTGYDLWLADAAVPAAMHAQIHHDPAMRLAIAELVRWDGRVLEDVEAPIALREAV
jgi:uncharacterized protein (TIGR02680 family)